MPKMYSWVHFVSILLFSTFCFVESYSNVSQTPDSLLQQLNSADKDTLRVKILVQLSESSVIPRDEARQYALDALALSQRINYDFGIGLSNYALIAFASGPAEIEHYTSVALDIFRKNNNKQYESRTLLTASAQHLNVSANYIKSLSYARQFLLINEERKDYGSLAIGWNLIGEVYRVSKNYTKAIESYHQSIYYVKMGKVSDYPSPYINLATVYKDQGKYNAALSKYDSVLRFLVETNKARSNTMAYIFNRKAQTHILMNSYDQALLEAKESLNLYSALRFNRGRVLALSTVAESYLNLGEYENAIDAGTKAIEIATSIGYVTEGFDQTHKIVAKSYESLGNYRMAYLFQTKFTDVLYKIYNPKSYIELANEQVKLETEKRELEYKLLEKQASIDEAIIEKQKFTNIFIAIALILVIIITIFIYINLRSKQRLNYQLKEKQDEILQQSEELKAQAEELQAYNEKIKTVNNKLEEIVDERTSKIKKQNERLIEYAYFNAHNLRGPVARILGLIYLMDKDFPEETYGGYKKMLKEAGEELDDVVREIKNRLETE